MKPIVSLLGLGTVLLSVGCSSVTSDERISVDHLTDGVDVHSFVTGDPLGDSAYAVTTPSGAFTLEAPAFRQDFAVWSHYLRALKNAGKPLQAVLVSDHAGRGDTDWTAGAPVMATASASEAIAHGSVRAITDNLAQAFGRDFEHRLLKPSAILTVGPQTIGGITVDIRPNGDGFLVVLPRQKAVFMHMLGADSHSIVPGENGAEAMIRTLKTLQNEGINRIYSAHHAPENAADLQTKINYLEGVAAAGRTAADAEDFKTKVRALCAGCSGNNYLDMTVNFFFPKKS